MTRSFTITSFIAISTCWKLPSLSIYIRKKYYFPIPSAPRQENKPLSLILRLSNQDCFLLLLYGCYSVNLRSRLLISFSWSLFPAIDICFSLSLSLSYMCVCVYLLSLHSCSSTDPPANVSCKATNSSWSINVSCVIGSVYSSRKTYTCSLIRTQTVCL